MTIDLAAAGRQVGDIMLRWSDNATPLGYYPVPVISIRGGTGPTVLIIGGTHGDEFEGPAAMMRVAESLDPARLAGQVVILPALNAPAFFGSSRVSPLDGANLNRAFPGDPDGGPTAMIADFLETELLPMADAVFDLHSGGKASFFAPCSLSTRTDDPALTAANDALARAFGLPLMWRLGQHNDNRSVNSAAARVGVPMIAAELGGCGGVDPAIADATEAGLWNGLRHLGCLDDAPLMHDTPRSIEIASPFHSLYAPSDGMFDRHVSAGQDVTVGQMAGRFFFPQEPARASVPVTFPADGFVLAHCNRGMVKRGDLLALVAQDEVSAD
ncbi:succinylglutamate desuccinylase/aspartoacylase family protein [Chachezhania sediminis]|uniref:succinylglutamate desuccinylase/aspartoacylase family protein n=1 Tax=Chachezhania sediminis TaxID=2599291 RepID=UPI001E647ACD|nr:succinylglutamate desuccinylase/aspartoacylase family protein [Chachezhania sediminis]